MPSVNALFQGAFDAVGNFYITGQDLNYNAIIGVIRGGCSATGLQVLSTANALGQYIYGIQVTRFGKLAIGDQSNKAIYTYNPPVNGALGKPIATTPLPADALFQFAFTAKGAFVFVSEQKEIAKYEFPGGGNPLQVFGQRQQLTSATGLVVAPPAQP